MTRIEALRALLDPPRQEEEQKLRQIREAVTVSDKLAAYRQLLRRIA